MKINEYLFEIAFLRYKSYLWLMCNDSLGEFAAWAGQNNVDNTIPGENMDMPVKYCLGLLTSNGWTINGPKE